MKKLEIPILFVIGLIAIVSTFYGRMVRNNNEMQPAPLALENGSISMPKSLPTETPQGLIRAKNTEKDLPPQPVPEEGSEALPTPMPAELSIAPAIPVPEIGLVPPAPTPQG